MAIAPIPRDDAGIRRLQETNAARAAGTITPVSPTPRIEDRPAEPAPPVVGAPEQDRRRADRRARPRRRTQRGVLLDTRDKQERRHGERRGQAQGAARRRGGVDLYV